MDKTRVLFLVLAVMFLALFIYILGETYKSKLPLGNSRQEEKVEIILGGDVMLGRSVMSTSMKLNDPSYPFRKIGEVLKDADLVFVNLENPVIENCPLHNDGFVFCADPSMVEGLVFAEVDVVSLANNHSGNYGKKGLERTRELLQQSGIDHTGEDNLIIKKIGGTSFGFLGFNFVNFPPNQNDYDLISRSNDNVDILIVGVHWGEEYQESANSSQSQWGRKMVDKGADVIVGHHSHWVQDWEMVNGKPVYYSLGNLVFDQMWSEETKKGMLVRLTYRGNELVNQDILSTYMTKFGQPEIVSNN